MSKKFDLDHLDDVVGLSDEEARTRLTREGPNEIPSDKKRSFWSIAYSVIREPMLLLLIGGGIIYMLLGDVEEALMLLAFVFVIMGITFYQERRMERTLEALRDLSSPRALVIRNRSSRRIAGREVVRGDIIILSEGDRVPADGIVLSSNNLTIEESILTGESIPVTKRESSEPIQEMGPPGGDDSPFVFSGTMVVSGLGIAQAVAIGIHTEFGKIGRSLQSIEPGETLLQREVRVIVRNLAVLGLSLSVIVAVIYGLTMGNWLQGVLTSITLAMAILPEEFPVVLTIFLALGAWRISRSHVLTRHMPAIETLGSITVLCTDKTGTLTQNRMSAEKIYVDSEFYEIDLVAPKAPPEKFHRLIEFSILASQSNPFDPMEKALKELASNYQPLTEHLHRDWKLMREYPLSKELLAISRVWRSPDMEDYVIAAKGAPEAIFDLCHLDDSTREKLAQSMDAMAKESLRVIAVAAAHFRRVSLPGNQHDFRFEFLGLVGFGDPIRPSVRASIGECYRAGIRTLMITGDYPVTARHIAREIGIRSTDEIATGTEIDTMTDEALRERVKTANIFARVVPEQKLRLVSALKANGEIVAMTGDGVNDAPALKAANIGIAMGGRGTDVAREASALVLLDDDFSSIVKAIRLGRRIFDNLRKAMGYILAVHVPIAGLSLIPVILKWPLVLMPVHVLFLELIIDPASSVGFEAEPEEPDTMEHPPHSRRERILNRQIVLSSLLQGAMVLIVSLLIYGLNLHRSTPEARTLTFTTLVLANLGLILANRFRSSTVWGGHHDRNRTVLWIVAATLVFLGLAVYVPFLRRLFSFEILHTGDLLLCLVASLATFLWFEAVKYFTRQRSSRISDRTAST